MSSEGYVPTSSAREEFRELIRLAAPLAAAQAGNQLMGLVDIAVLGRLGSREIGAAGLGNSLFFAFYIVGMGIVMGVDPLIAQAVGAGNFERARRLLWQGVWLAFLVGAVLSVPMLFAPGLLEIVGVDSTLIPQATQYLYIRIVGFVPMLLFIVARSYLQAFSITRPMLVAMVSANVFNLFADILLVFGGRILPEWTGPLRGFPAMGVAGAAVATVLGSLLQLWIIADSIRRHGRFGEASSRKPVRQDMLTSLRIGLPVGLQMGAEVGVFALVGILAGRLGEMPLAAHQVTISLASLTFTVALGIGAAGSVRVGRAIGAIDPVGTRRAGLVAFGGGALIMSLAALAFWIFPRALASLISNQSNVILASIPLLAVAAVFQISDGIQGVGAGVLRGAGDTRFAFVANLIGHWIIGLPIAIYLGFHKSQGIVGLWWGLCVGLSCVAVMLLVRFIYKSSQPIAPIAH